jgi:hypothetical protein
LDTLEPPPTTVLLSAEEAKEKLREIVEGFFFRRRSDQEQPPARHLLVRSPPGLGKTKEAMEWATRYQTEQEGKESILELSRSDITLAGVWAQVAIFVPRHELARQVKEVIERNRDELGQPVEVPVLRGRDHEADKGNAPCRRWREARELGRRAAHTGGSVGCGRPTGPSPREGDHPGAGPADGQRAPRAGAEATIGRRPRRV